MRKTLSLSLLFLLISAIALPQEVRAVMTPTEEIRTGINRIMELIDDQSMPKAERNERIIQLLKDYFAFEVMARWILGPHWRKATAAQREHFIDLYTRLLEETYRGRIEAYADRYTDETVEYAEERIRGDKALVSTLIHTKNQLIPVDYKVVQTPKGWRVYDVVIEEVSLVRNFRSTYGEILRNEGFDGLFSRMDEKITALGAEERAEEAAK